MNYGYLPNETFSERLERVSAYEAEQKRKHEEQYRANLAKLSKEPPTKEHLAIMAQALADDYTKSQRNGWSTE